MRFLRKIYRKLIKRKKSRAKKLFFTKDFFNGNNYIIGDYSYGKPNVLFENDKAKLTIGKFCSIADKVTIFLGGNHRTDWVTTYPFNALKLYFPEASQIKGHPATKGDVWIGNDVWIGSNVIILSGVKIGNGAVIAAGSVVTKDVGVYEIWGGNPVRFIKKRFDNETIIRLNKLQWWDWDINKIRNNLDILCSTNFENL